MTEHDNTSTRWRADLPSNIALIKYMGKLDFEKNIPTNPSLSLTLPYLRSYVELNLTSTADHWELLTGTDLLPTALSHNGQTRFLQHLQRIKQRFNSEHCFTVRSANNFPSGCGLASSAASFAALTKAACLALTALHPDIKIDLIEQTQLSRQGSGSSCRSFFPHWAIWQHEYACAIELPWPDLIHRVVVIDQQEKTVSSSAAHRAVATSPLFITRADRARERLEALLTHLHCREWHKCYQVVWAEFMDMHELFATATPVFNYFTVAVDEVLAFIKKDWRIHKDGPLVTMDAGPNIHLLFRPDQRALVQRYETVLGEIYPVLGAGRVN